VHLAKYDSLSFFDGLVLGCEIGGGVPGPTGAVLLRALSAPGIVIMTVVYEGVAVGVGGARALAGGGHCGVEAEDAGMRSKWGWVVGLSSKS